MTDVLLTAVLPNANGLVEDRYVNTFAVKDLVPNGSALDGALVAVADFYRAVAPGALTAIGNILSPAVDRASLACEVLAYDITGKLGGQPHGSPIDVIQFTMPTPTNAEHLPAEVAFVLTTEAQGRADAAVEAPDGGDPGIEIDRPMQRRTGRVYIGPLNTIANQPTNGRPSSVIRDTARLAAADLADDIRAQTIAGDGTGGWSVWSRKDAVLRPIFHVSTDDAFDTQRRRGLSATARVRLAV